MSWEIKLEVGKKYNLSNMYNSPYKIICYRKLEGFDNTYQYIAIDNMDEIIPCSEGFLKNATEHVEPIKRTMDVWVVYDDKKSPSNDIWDMLTNKYVWYVTHDKEIGQKKREGFKTQKFEITLTEKKDE